MKLGAIVIDSNISDELSDFYKRLLGWEKECEYFEGDRWFIVKSGNGEGTPLVFQEIAEHERPAWPAMKGSQQQMLHLDFYVKTDEYENEIKHAIFCGAVLSDVQLTDSWSVMLDPAGHPFCIIPVPEAYE